MAGRKMPIAHDSRVTCLSTHVSKLSQITGKFSFNCCCNQLLRPRSQQIRPRVREPDSTRTSNNISPFHSGVSPSVALLSFNNKSTRYAAKLQTTQTPDSVIVPLESPRDTKDFKLHCYQFLGEILFPSRRFYQLSF